MKRYTVAIEMKRTAGRRLIAVWNVVRVSDWQTVYSNTDRSEAERVAANLNRLIIEPFEPAAK